MAEKNFTDFSRIESKIIAIFLRCCHDSSKVFYLFPLTLPTYFTLPLHAFFLSSNGPDATVTRKQTLLMASYTPEWLSIQTYCFLIRKEAM